VSDTSPQISVVMPCLNEAAAVGAVVDQAWEGIDRAGRSGEVIVVDNGSTDDSAEIAASRGASVVIESR
jgi:glycosyltransferase involved in cell wall biosynthesis